jgi:hypothetical protein
MNPTTTTATEQPGRLLECRLQHQVVAADDRSQTHRGALPDLRDGVLRARRLFAGLVRLELMTPKGDLFEPDMYNRMFTLHGV